MYKNKLVAEVNKEVEKENEEKALEAKKQKIRQMLSIIESKEKQVADQLAQIEIEKKDVATLKEQLEKEDFSFLTDGWINRPYCEIINILYDKNSSATPYYINKND